MENSSLLEEVNAVLTKMSSELRDDDHFGNPKNLKSVGEKIDYPDKPQNSTMDNIETNHAGKNSLHNASNSDYFDLQEPNRESLTTTDTQPSSDEESLDDQTETADDEDEDYYRRVTVSGYEDSTDTQTDTQEIGAESETDTLLDYDDQGKN